MQDNMIGCDWENSIIRQAIVESGDKEALRLFDEEQEQMRLAAEKELAEMEKEGMFLPEKNEDVVKDGK